MYVSPCYFRAKSLRSAPIPIATKPLAHNIYNRELDAIDARLLMPREEEDVFYYYYDLDDDACGHSAVDDFRLAVRE